MIEFSHHNAANPIDAHSCKLVVVEHAGAYSYYGTRKVDRIYSAERSLPLDYTRHSLVEALIWP